MELISIKKDKQNSSLQYFLFEIDFTFNNAFRFSTEDALIRIFSSEYTAKVKYGKGSSMKLQGGDKLPKDWTEYVMQTNSFAKFNGAKTWFCMYNNEPKLKIIVKDAEKYKITKNEIEKFVKDLQIESAISLGFNLGTSSEREYFKLKTGMEMDDAIDMMTSPQATNKN